MADPKGPDAPGSSPASGTVPSDVPADAPVRDAPSDGASPPEGTDASTVTEPFLVGSALGMVTLLAIVGVPIWMMITAVIHTQNIQGALTQLRLARQEGLDVGGQDVLFWEVLLSPALLVLAGVQALVITVLVVGAVAAGVALWRWLDRSAERGASRRARRRYDAMDGDVVVRTDAWTHGLPEREPEGRAIAATPTDAPAPHRDVP
jgi:hypothetical protein